MRLHQNRFLAIAVICGVSVVSGPWLDRTQAQEAIVPQLARVADDVVIEGRLAVQNSPGTGQIDFAVINNSVGIGTVNPLARLHLTEGDWILGSFNPLPAFGVSGWLTSSEGNLYEGGGGTWAHHFSAYGGGDIARFGTSGGSGEDTDTKVVIKNDGKVGVGTTAPHDKLTVGGGSLGFYNAFTVGGTTTEIPAGSLGTVVASDSANPSVLFFRIGSGGSGLIFIHATKAGNTVHAAELWFVATSATSRSVVQITSASQEDLIAEVVIAAGPGNSHDVAVSFRLFPEAAVVKYIPLTH